VDYQGAAALGPAFAAAYREVYGYEPEGRAVEVESLRVVASGNPPPAEPAAPGVAEPAATGGGGTGPGQASRRAFLGGAWREVPAGERAGLAAGAAFAGPALVLEDHTATVVEEGWTCRVDAAGALVLRRRPPASPGPYT